MISRIKYIRKGSNSRGLRIALGLRFERNEFIWDDVTGTDYIRRRFNRLNITYTDGQCFVMIEYIGKQSR